MKKINIYIAILTLGLFAISCNESEDLVTAEAKEAALTTIGSSGGALLGNPTETGEVIFVTAMLDYSVTVSSPNVSDVQSMTVYKSYGTESVEITTASTYPIEVNYSSIGDFMEGFSATAADLAIGDVIGFHTEMTMTDGRVLAQAANRVSLTVQCLSDLAGSYSMTGQRDDGASYSFPVVITELGPGSYVSSRSGSWAKGVLATPTGEAPMLFNDVCGQLYIPMQTLGDFYSNGVWGEGDGAEVTGSVDPSTGVITYSYTIEFSAGNRVYTEVLTPN
ncbi:hypothetical protein [Marinoscillum sp. 108]|jgi:hypothetical protein|uniref:DUF5689 domain-containing protein n=1 Tax=Marinoscillum luteum TaxID=861051 RepID=A0ABW7NB54_9BACT|nr:hypothetical protein [Marinoscillum sp. 108]VXD19982.1 conserved hypothetical protein [Marinoscillum sp. 108]